MCLQKERSIRAKTTSDTNEHVIQGKTGERANVISILWICGRENLPSFNNRFSYFVTFVTKMSNWRTIFVQMFDVQ